MVDPRRITQAVALRPIRQPNTIAYMGTSRNAAQYLDPGQRNRGNAGWMNWMGAHLRSLDKPLFNIGNVAVSGQRTDEFNLAGARALVASGCSLVCLDGPINDIAQAYPSSGTVVATAFTNQKAQIKALNDDGAQVVYVMERGAANFTTTMIGQTNDFNQMMAEFLAFGDGDGRGPPNCIVIDPRPSTIITQNNGSAIGLKNSADGVHDNVEGAKALGSYAALKLAPYLRTLPGYRLASLHMSKSGLGSRSMIQSAGFTGSSAAAGTGNTGETPTNVTSYQTGSATAVFSLEDTQPDSDGNAWGKQAKMVCTAAGAGTVSFVMTLDRTNISVSDVIRGGVEIDVDAGAVALQGVACDLEWFPTTGGTSPTYDMYPSTIGLDAGGYQGLCLEPPPLVIPAFTGTPFTNLAVRATFNGAGGAVITIRKPWAFRGGR